MPSKYQIISELASRTARDITSKAERYTDFLVTAANNYKYSFKEQLLIHAQKPDATACAEIETWNRLGRWVNKGTRGIALLVDRDVPYKLRHVFDYSDTNSRAGRVITLWQMRPQYEETVRESLQDSFGEVELMADFPHFLIEISKNAVEDNFSDYLSNLQSVKGDSFLEELDDLNLEVWLKDTLRSSVAYMALVRAGYQPNLYFTRDDFSHIYDFNTIPVISVLGAATSDISEMVIREIAETVKGLEKEEKQRNRTFARDRSSEYHDSRNNKTERSNEDGTDLYDAGRLSDPRPDRAGEPEDWEVWNAASDLPSRAPGRNLHRDAPQRNAEQPSGGSGRSGQPDDGQADRADESPERRDGADEGRRSDEVGSGDELNPTLGGGSSPERPDLRINLPSVGEQLAMIAEAEADTTSAFAISQEDIDAVLTRGSGVHEGKFRIYEQYLKQEPNENNIAFLKDEYGIGGAYPAIPGRQLDENHDGKGIKISRGSIMHPDAEVLLSWKKIEKRIGELISADLYLSRAEKEHYPAYRAEAEARRERQAVASEFRSIIYDYNDYVTQLGEEEKKLNLYYLSGCWGAFGVGEKKMYARTSDGDFILPMMREAMNTIIADNTHLTERCEAMLTALGSNLAKPLEPTYDELNPPAEPEKEYRFSLGDTVYLGTHEYEVLSFNEQEVVLFDTQFPLINKTMTREEFDNRLKENPLNDHLLQPVREPTSETEPKEIGVPEDEKPEPEESPASFIDHYYVVDDLASSPLKVTEYTDLEEALEAYFSLPAERMKAFGVMNTKEMPGSLDFIQCMDGKDTLIEDYAKTDDETWRNPEIEGLVDQLKERLSEREKPMAPPPQKQRVGKITPHVLLPDIHTEYRTNFKIERDDIGVGTPLERFYHNKMAIQLLKKLESEQRLANTTEQRVLADYVGWGGLSEFFKEDNPHYLELKELLTEDEYASARESTLTAFYTPPVVIKAVYNALENMHFKTGNVLEPSCGIGNFMGLVPESMASAKFYGVELDSISGRIAQQLYQNSSIAVQGFEDTNLPDSFFDAAVGNVPFGQFKVPDKRYDKNNFLIHDYFFARTLDKVRPGGVVAFITSKGTMDKENPAVRKYIAQRADLLGAIRLPNDTFKDAAGTEVTSDIIFLQKRDRLIDIEPEWVHLATDENGIRMNSYFVSNPEMVLGDMRMISGAHGPESACIAFEDAELSDLLQDAVQNIHAEITEYELDDLESEDEDLSIPADPLVRNFSFTVVDGKLYFRENSRMNPVEVSMTAENRIKGMIAIRDCVRRLIEYQTEDYSDAEIKGEQDKLNELYDDFSKKYGLINARANNSAFSSDSSYCLLSSLEVLDDEGNFVRKADMFSKRTIKQKVVVQSVDTASEAYALSLAEKAKIDMPYMMELTGKSEQELFEDLKGVIFLNPLHTSDDDGRPKYLPADEYLSGNVREKLQWARRSAELYPEDYSENVRALEAVQPIDLTASEISVRLGATWLPPEIVEQFMFELFSTPRYCQWNIHVHFSQYTGEWNVEGKSYDRGNVKAYNTYGTTRINGYKIMEDTLNLKDVRIFDYIEDENGRKTAVLNKKETAIAQGKQELIKQAFADWIWNDPDRREKLTKLYNEKFNSIRPREYDGSHMSFVGINPEITLRPHQVNAIAHILYGGNTLLAHVVGAGKTFEMVAAAQESKRLGLCQKSLFVVPNHLTEQWASEYLQLYPSANILVATKKDFETKNRKKFCGRIATGDYDAVIIGHSQFEKIPMSIERQRAILEQQLDEVVEGIAELKRNRGDNFSIKQLERTKKTVKQKLEKLNDQSRKDDLVTFEELGIDRIFIDEAHYYKNLAAFTKMRNVGGISQTEAMKSSDLYMKCRYLDELTGGRGVVFATGTPISNSMVEMYTMQKYLQYSTLRRNDLLHFDSWASTFGETVTAIELSPEGTGYRSKTRFAKFYNLPELMSMFKETADIQTADMLNLPVPEAHYHNVVLKPSKAQKKMVEGLSDRAERVRAKMVDSSTDNMLLITNDGRKLALDQRLMNDMLPDSETSKVSACADNVFDIWQRTAENRSTQMVFCDLSTPHNDGKFNVYDDLRKKLIEKGIPAEEIAYIHTAETEVKKKELFGKVRSGQIRVLLGSTQKMGAGTNVQTRLIALHHLDCPWRPSDLQQREGRIIRQGNENPEVDIYTYVTENTFDSYLYQLVEGKQKFIGQIMTSKSPVRSAEDIDETALSYAEIKALCAGNPHIKEKMDLDIDVSRLKLLKANHLSQRYALEDQIIKQFPQQIKSLEQRIEGYKADMTQLAQNTLPNEDGFSPMIMMGGTVTDKKAAGEALIGLCKSMTSPDPIHIGEYRGFDMELFFDSFSREYKITLRHELRHTVTLGTDIFGNIQRLDNALGSFPEKLSSCEAQLENTKVQLENAKLEVQKPFPQEEELKTKTARLNELNAMLNLDKRENEIVDGERAEEDPVRSSDDRER
jgi:N12 class adenine-specific DNA methylase/adenine-specific DNA methylase